MPMGHEVVDGTEDTLLTALEKSHLYDAHCQREGLHWL